MIKVERSLIPPASLAIEEKKKNGSYRCKDVIDALARDFHEKCYLCEMKPVSDPEVEHLLPHHNRSIKERVFDWNNLFYACSHCNSVKNKKEYEEGIIDCCSRDPEKLLSYSLQENRVAVSVFVKSDSEAILTAKLIEEIFNTTSTGIRTKAAQARLYELQRTMVGFYATLEQYKHDPDNNKVIKKLRGLLSREAEYSCFTRAYARKIGIGILKEIE